MPVSKRVAKAVTIDQPCVNVQIVNPYFMLATLAGRLDSENVLIDFERTVHADMPLSLGSWWLDKATYISPFSRTATWSPKRYRDMWNW